VTQASTSAKKAVLNSKASAVAINPPHRNAAANSQGVSRSLAPIEKRRHGERHRGENARQRECPRLRHPRACSRAGSDGQTLRIPALPTAPGRSRGILPSAAAGSLSAADRNPEAIPKHHVLLRDTPSLVPQLTPGSICGLTDYQRVRSTRHCPLAPDAPDRPVAVFGHELRNVLRDRNADRVAPRPASRR
jgi:hypothetical protein